MEKTLKRAAAYVRVSTYQESQEKSIADQVRMLNEIIEKDETLVNVGTYIDQGATGKYQTKRKQFLALMKDCMEGKVDVIYCKQMSRFGRNALESMTAIEKLRAIGVAVRFVMDDIDTIEDRDCSRLAILASMAEDERDNMQDTMIWSFHRRLEQGHYIFRPDMLYGYGLDENKNMVVIPEEAVAVRYIFEEYAKGTMVKKICEWLNEHGYRTRKGLPFNKSSISDITTNEKYYGDMLIGKWRTDGPKRVKNNGESEMYLFENHHEPIISKELFEKCAEVRRARSEHSKPVQNYDRADPFRRKVFCGQCGSLFICQGRTNCTHDFAKLAFVCGKATRTNRRECRNKLQRIGTLEDSFIAVFNYLRENRSVLSDIVTDNEEFNEVTARLEELRESEKKYFELEVKGLMNEQMTKNHTKLVGEMLRLENRRKVFLTRNYEISACNENLKKLQKILKTAKPMTEMDPKMCELIVKRILVMDRNNLIFELTTGHKVKVEVLDFYKTKDEIRRVYVTE